MLVNAWRRLIAFGFRLLYNEMAWTYDLVSWVVSLGAWRDWQLAALPFVEGQRVLEVGHGPGHMLVALLGAGHKVYGLDLSPAMARRARKRVSAPLVRGRVQDLPFGPAIFDSVLSTFPTEYIADPRTLASVYRVLKTEGRFVILPEGHLTGTTPLHRFIEWLFQITGQRQGPFAVDESDQWPRPNQWQLLERQFASAGFHVDVSRLERKRSAVTIVVARKA